jgi:isochorismate synthase
MPSGTSDTIDSSRISPLSSVLSRARELALARHRSVLASVVERIPMLDPLSALQSAAHAVAHSAAHSAVHDTTPDGTTGDITDVRMYWTRPADDFALAGLGTAASFTPEGADRFATIDREWTALIADAVIDDPSGGAPGAGPALMGGFAFDPEGPRTDLWQDFAAARLVLPRMQIAVTGGKCWLTTNVLVGLDGRPDVEPATLASARVAFVSAAHGAAALTNAAHARTSADFIVEESLAGSIAAVASGDGLTYADVRGTFDWRATVHDAVEAIHAGKIEKVVLAREMRATAPYDFNVTAVLRQLRAAHPTCYVFGCWHGASAFVGATPERLVRVDGHDVQASSLAGSVRRGVTPADDAAQAAQLLTSTKDRAEHEIVRQALCAGLARLCDDVTASDEPALLSLPHVHHLYTAVRARLRDPHTILQLVAQLHPTPAVGGEPRNAALRFIREHEKMDRGWYAAPIGWLQRDHGEFAVALRSALIQGAAASLFAGCGVVADSDPDQEYAESLLKLRPMQAALAAAADCDDGRAQ